MQLWQGPSQTKPAKEGCLRTATITTALGAIMAFSPGTGRAGGDKQACSDRAALAAARPIIGMLPLLMVQTYRTRRPEFGPLGACHLEPTCSTYAEQVLQEHGNLKGGILIAKRIYRCRRTHG